MDKKAVALKKLQKYCAYQDRCHQEVRTKLLSMQVYGDDLEQIMSELIREDYLNELRFAKSYARGKFRIKYWGWNRIKLELEARNISDYCIRKAKEEISEEEYEQAIHELIEKTKSKHSDLSPLLLKNKCYQTCVKKGYEVDNVLKALGEIEEELS